MKFVRSESIAKSIGMVIAVLLSVIKVPAVLLPILVHARIAVAIDIGSISHQYCC